MLEHIFIIDFSGCRFLPAGIIANLEIANFIPTFIHGLDQVPLIPLHVKHVIQNFTGWAVHTFADQVGLIGVLEK